LRQRYNREGMKGLSTEVLQHAENELQQQQQQQQCQNE